MLGYVLNSGFRVYSQREPEIIGLAINMFPGRSSFFLHHRVRNIKIDKGFD